MMDDRTVQAHWERQAERLSDRDLLKVIRLGVPRTHMQIFRTEARKRNLI